MDESSFVYLVLEGVIFPLIVYLVASMFDDKTK